MSYLPCLSGRGSGCSMHSQFLKQAFWLEGQEPTLSLGSELITLPVCRMGTLHTWYWLYSRGNQPCPPPLSCSPTLGPLGSTTSRHCCQPFCSVGLEDMLHSAWGCDFTPSLNIDKLGYRPSKFLIWGSESSRSTLHFVPWLECAPDLVLQMGRATGYSLGSAGMNLVCQRLCWLFKAPSPFCVTVRFPVAEPRGFPCTSLGVRSD